jgi:hypothetical protein
VKMWRSETHGVKETDYHTDSVTRDHTDPLSRWGTGNLEWNAPGMAFFLSWHKKNNHAHITFWDIKQLSKNKNSCSIFRLVLDTEHQFELNEQRLVMKWQLSGDCGVLP